MTKEEKQAYRNEFKELQKSISAYKAAPAGSITKCPICGKEVFKMYANQRIPHQDCCDEYYLIWLNSW